LPRITAYPMPVIGLIEERVFDELEDIASQSIMGHRVLTQLSLSAFLYAGSSGYSRADERRVAAYLASLQIDFLIVDADWQPVVAVNIERDAVSGSDALEVEGEICRNAGVAYLIVQGDGLTKERRRGEIEELLQPRKASRRSNPPRRPACRNMLWVTPQMGHARLFVTKILLYRTPTSSHHIL
jgi:hypothetical protein